MGQLRFHAPSPEKLLPHAAELAYLAGLEAIPWRSHNQLADGILTLERSISESGNLYIPWNIPRIGQRVLSTCTLMERERPYTLVTELARGTLHRARALVAEMEAQGRVIPEATHTALHEATAALIRATTGSETATADAEYTILIASESIESLERQQISAQLGELSTSVGSLTSILVSQLNEEPLPEPLVDTFLSAFHAVNIPFRWRQLQPSHTQIQWENIERQLQWSRRKGSASSVGRSFSSIRSRCLTTPINGPVNTMPSRTPRFATSKRSCSGLTTLSISGYVPVV